MLKFSHLRSISSPVCIPEDHDRKLRRAFGRFAEAGCRHDGAKVVETYYGTNGCFHCDCRPDAERAPLLFLVAGKHLRREDRIGGNGTPHDDGCDFAYEADEQKQLVKTWLPFKRNEHQLKLVPEFKDDETLSPPTCLHKISTRSRAPKLARVLFNLLHEAKSDRIFSTERLLASHNKQNDHILEAALKFSVAPDRSLLDWIALSLREFYELKRRLEAKPDGWNRPCGIFIEAFGKIEDKTLYPYRSDMKPIKVVGDLAVFGEKENLRRPPYLVIGTMTFPTRDSKEAVVYNAYAHPCYQHYKFMLVDSHLERKTIELLVDCRNWLAKSHDIAVVIEKPMFDLGATETDVPREVCKPDFVLRCRRKDGARVIVIVETMGYDDPVYRERKRRMRSLFENIKGGKPPHAVIEYDCLKREMKPKAIDDQFRQNVCKTILEKLRSE